VCLLSVPINCIYTEIIRAVTISIYQYVAILQCDAIDNYLLQHTNILHRVIYCNVLCELELDHWNVNVDKILFLALAINLLVVLRLDELLLALPFNNNQICIAIQQYIVNILHAICNMPICCIVTARDIIPIRGV